MSGTPRGFIGKRFYQPLVGLDPSTLDVDFDVYAQRLSAMKRSQVLTALRVSYDNSVSGLVSTTVKAALDELHSNVLAVPTMSLIGSTTASADADVTFTLPTQANDAIVAVTFTDVEPATDDQNLNWAISANGGSNYSGHIVCRGVGDDGDGIADGISVFTIPGTTTVSALYDAGAQDGSISIKHQSAIFAFQDAAASAAHNLSFAAESFTGTPTISENDGGGFDRLKFSFAAGNIASGTFRAAIYDSPCAGFFNRFLFEGDDQWLNRVYTNFQTLKTAVTAAA